MVRDFQSQVIKAITVPALSLRSLFQGGAHSHAMRPRQQSCGEAHVEVMEGSCHLCASGSSSLNQTFRRPQPQQTSDYNLMRNRKPEAPSYAASEI